MTEQHASPYANRVHTGRKAMPMRSTFYGVEGVGKSTIASQFPSPITIAAEDGVSHIDTSSFIPKDYNDLIGFLTHLYHSPDNDGFQSLNLDTIGWIEAICVDAVSREHNVPTPGDIAYGKGKGFVEEKFNNIITACSALYGKGMHINFIAHALVKKFNNPEGEDYDRYQVMMQNTALAEKVTQWCDNTFFMNYDTIIKQEQQGMSKKPKGESLNKRQLHCNRQAAFYAKNRYKFPDVIQLPPNEVDMFKTLNSYYLMWVKETLNQKKPASKAK